ncbi:Ger(x)C family spore germination protein [Paenibacillus hodogayensis]|uniref:Ger(X)C family spore germination protein n=1 Tax=Paenibacillus hodogayensis TaxID=279208 RepID=A0ABV5W598_9BACL
MRTTVLGLILGVLLSTVLTGCWNRRELNDLGIQLGTAIDKVGSQYHLSVQVVEPGEVAKRSGKGDISSVTMFKATAPSLLAAFRKLTESSPRKIYGAHIRVLVLGESLAKEGIANAIDLLVRDPEVRSDFYVMIARGTSAESVLKVLTSLEKIPANELFHALDTSAKAWAPTTTVTLDQLVEKLLTEGENPVLTGVRVEGDRSIGEMKQNLDQVDPAAQLQLFGLGVLHKDRLIGWLNETESKGYNYITDQVKSTAGYVECPSGGLLTLETIQSHTKLKAKMENGEPTVDIHLVDESNIAEVACTIDLEDPQTIARLEKEQEEKKIELMRRTIEAVQSKFKADIFGFGQALYRSEPKAWARLKNEWSEHFAKLKVTYHVEVHIRRIGTTNESIRNGLKG